VTENPPNSVDSPRLDHRRLLKLLIGWAAAVLIPGVVTINQPVLVAYVFWGIGFVIALVLFITIAQMTDITDLWPWLVASILPWAVDVAVPHSLLWAPVAVLAVGAFAVWIHRRASVADRLLHDGLPGTGTVIEVIEPRTAGATVANSHVRRSVRVSVTRPDKAMAYEAVLRDLFKVDDLPEPGDSIELRVDPADAMRIAKWEVPSQAQANDEADDEAVDEAVDE
jgi:hypothetical protein